MQWPDRSIGLLRELNRRRYPLSHWQDPPSRELLIEKVRGCSGVLSMLSDKIDGSVMDSAG
ncbi:MAG: D-glycerate dehydrogenase, partial [Pirellula sp.]